MKNGLCQKNFERALAWHKVGVSTFPLVFKKKRPIIKWSQYTDRLPKPFEIKRFFTTYQTNLGVICGGVFGLVVVDFDTEHGYDKFILDIPKGISYIFQKTYRVKTPRGMHVYLRSYDVPSFKDTKRKIDIKSTGGYVVAPFSTHPSGKNYIDVDVFDTGKILSMPKNSLLNLFPEEKSEEEKIDWSKFKNEKKNDSIFPDGDADLNDIRNRVPILRLAMEYTSMFPERKGSTFWKGRCPLPEHDDKDPSFWVDTKTGLCGCFGGCPLSKKSTDVIGLYALINSVTYGEAAQELGYW